MLGKQVKEVPDKQELKKMTRLLRDTNMSKEIKCYKNIFIGTISLIIKKINKNTVNII